LDSDIMNMEDRYELGNSRQCTLTDKIAGYTQILGGTNKLVDIFTK
jgi:hypothetical protein